ncbi:hypothetical protein D9M69_156240 [compost metagenome]
MKSKAPIIASADAAGTGPMPKSPQSAMKCVWIRPLVLRPQIKKVPARTQKAWVRAASRNTTNGARSVSGAGGADGCTGAAAGTSPNAARPTSAGRLRIRPSTSTASSAHAASTGSTATRQPICSISQAATGRNASWPVAELAVSRPMTSPRRALNQRLATTAASTSAVSPEPTPSISPHATKSCHSSVDTVASAMPPAISASAAQTTLRTPKRSIRMAENGAIRPNSAKRKARIDEISSVFQPISRASGDRNAPGRPSAAEVVSITRKVRAATSHA